MNLKVRALLVTSARLNFSKVFILLTLPLFNIERILLYCSLLDLVELYNGSVRRGQGVFPDQNSEPPVKELVKEHPDDGCRTVAEERKSGNRQNERNKSTVRRIMADPKYANLPGLDLDAPDVYETDDR